MIRQIPDLKRITDALARAAVMVFDPEYQELLFTLSIFYEKADQYVNLLNQARLLNSLRTSKFGFAITAIGLTYSSPSSIVEFMTFLRFFGFAMKLCPIFGFSEAIVAEQWASAMFAKYGDLSLFKVLDKLEAIPGVDYERIAHFGFVNHFRGDRLLQFASRIRCPRQRVMFQLNLQGCDP